ncbi:hypothetical protein IQ265_23255 [Nodosilinea sp. LEGE 06152]|uniref:hypothetical protein n=1 Tax=Nodosilinea sp. LEGE 06152 TaxID=2777966 RepID=UPI00187E1075|nr:hypothetical protein [Nodosilinea sp. LEGE 06152]MBE9159730.1 hypothetical protein [Nodosilinea sp. LEGE 06152]
MNNNCESAQVSLSTDEHGRNWEHFWLGQNYAFSNQIPNRQSFTTTNPGEVIYQRGLCQWSAQSSAPMTAQSAPAMAPGEGGAMGLLLLVGIIVSGIYAWFTEVKPDCSDDYHPMADVPPLPTTWLPGNSTHGIPTVEPIEFERNSSEFEWNSQSDNANSQSDNANSQNSPDANSHGIPGVTADSQDWPPKTMGAPYDPLQPEQADEFETYCRHLEKDGLNPKGNDIIKTLWGVTPGRSAAYDAARKRRDTFAKRLEYYRYEGA